MGNYGVVTFKWADKDEDDETYNQNYCGGNERPRREEFVDLELSPADNKDSWSHRDYYFWVHYCGKDIITYSSRSNSMAFLHCCDHDLKIVIYIKML